MTVLSRSKNAASTRVDIRPVRTLRASKPSSDSPRCPGSAFLVGERDIAITAGTLAVVYITIYSPEIYDQCASRLD